jgi:hypothetical protein
MNPPFGPNMSWILRTLQALEKVLIEINLVKECGDADNRTRGRPVPGKVRLIRRPCLLNHGVLSEVAEKWRK